MANRQFQLFNKSPCQRDFTSLQEIVEGSFDIPPGERAENRRLHLHGYRLGSRAFKVLK